MFILEAFTLRNNYSAGIELFALVWYAADKSTPVCRVSKIMFMARSLRNHP